MATKKAALSPLFTDAELKALRKKFDDLEKSPDRRSDFKKYWSQREALERAHQIETNRRTKERAEEFLNGLLLLVGSRGATFYEFDAIFAQSGDALFRKEVQAADTPEVRRGLYTLLKALSEIPSSWAMSAYIRFLKGTGKQKDAKYHGAGMFGVSYGWAGREVDAIAAILTDGRNPYSHVLQSYADMQAELEEDPETEVVPDYDVQFKATRAERDKEFLDTLCSMLEKRGLGPVPTPAEKAPPVPRKKKEFSSGDIVRQGNARDLPENAHVRVTIEKRKDHSEGWTTSTHEYVVKSVKGQHCLMVREGTAYSLEGGWSERYTKWLVGAVFLGIWDKKFAVREKLKVNYQYRKPEANK